MNDITQCIIIKYINNNILLKKYRHINKVNYYQVCQASLQVDINSVSSV